jgi:2,3-dihydroxy-p-cumate/2,3-dihydroxybenzoate 3,4-dioxygenase
MSMQADFRYRGLGYVALNVTDLERAARFYGELVGLDRVSGTQQTVFLRCTDQHHDIVLCRATRPGLRRVGWQLESNDDLHSLRRRLKVAGLPVESVPAAECDSLAQGETLRIRDPACGLQHEFFAERQGIGRPFEPTVANITRLGHVVLGVEDYDGFLDFARRLNFRMSDHIPGFAAWLRCFPNPLHHSMAVQKADANRLHHVNFMVTSIDDIGRAVNRFRRAGVAIVFGPGRHLPSLSIFLYFTDPDGLTLEYSFGMEEFPETGARGPRSLEKSLDVIDVWGGRPEPQFGAVGLIEQGRGA